MMTLIVPVTADFDNTLKKHGLYWARSTRQA